MSEEQIKKDFMQDWYKIWMKQSNFFKETAEQNFKHAFDQTNLFNPEEHQQQIQAWLNLLKENWQNTFVHNVTRTQENYFKMMVDCYNQSSKLFIEQWINLFKKQKPIRNVHELYELWLNCCQEAYQNMLKSNNFQESYGEWMNSFIKFWKEILPKS